MKQKKPVSVIFDTDIGGDCDDAGALALLHRLCDLDEAELLTFTHCCSDHFKAGCISAIRLINLFPVNSKAELRKFLSSVLFYQHSAAFSQSSSMYFRLIRVFRQSSGISL